MYTVCDVVDRFEKLQLDYTREYAEFQVKFDNFFHFFGIIECCGDSAAVGGLRSLVALLLKMILEGALDRAAVRRI